MIPSSVRQRLPWRKLRLWLLAILVPYAALSITAGTINALKPGHSQDLVKSYRASRLWLNGYSPYRPYSDDTWKQLTGADTAPAITVVGPKVAGYPPFALMHLAILSPFEWETARRIWLVVNLLLALYIPLIIQKIWYSRWDGTDTALFTAFWLGGIGLRIGLGNGQHALITFAFLLTALYFVKHRSDSRAGLVMTMALHKYTLSAFLIPYLVIRKMYLMLGAMLFTGLILTGFFLFWINTSPLQLAEDYMVHLESSMQSAGLSESGNRGERGATQISVLLTWLIPDDAIAALLKYVLIGGGLVIACILAYRAQHQPTDTATATFMTLSLWSFYHGTYDAVFLILPIAVLIHYRQDIRGSRLYGGVQSLLGLLIGIWFLDASKVYRFFDPVPLDQIPAHPAYMILDGGYRLIIVLTFIAMLWLQWRHQNRLTSS